MVAFNIIVSIILTICGIIQIGRDSPIGYVLLACVVVKWVRHFQAEDKKAIDYGFSIPRQTRSKIPSMKCKIVQPKPLPKAPDPKAEQVMPPNGP